NCPRAAVCVSRGPCRWCSLSKECPYAAANLVWWTVRTNILERLGLIGRDAEGAVPALIDALNDWALRRDAAEALAKIGLPAVPALLQALANPDWDVRRAAEQALRRIEPDWLEDPWAQASVPALIQALADKHVHVRRAAVETLGRIGPQARAAVPTLVQALA